jgi:hypothetical protein
MEVLKKAVIPKGGCYLGFLWAIALPTSFLRKFP